MYLKGPCRICLYHNETVSRALIKFPFGSPSHRYLPKYYEVCKKCAVSSNLFDQLPHPTLPEYGEYNIFVSYDCRCCDQEHALSVEEAEGFIEKAKCPVREVSIDMGYCEKSYQTLDALVKDLPKRYTPNMRWKEREIEAINDKRKRLKKRRKEVESMK